MPTAASPGSIRVTLSRWLALQSFVGLSIACLAVYFATYWSFLVHHDDEFRRHEDFVRNALTEFGHPSQNLDLLRLMLDSYFQAHSDAAVSILEDGRLVYRAVPTRSERGWVTETFRIAGQPSVVELRLSLATGLERTILYRLAWTLVCTVLVGTLLVSATAAFLVRRGLRPLQRLADETAKAGPEESGHRIDVRKYAEELQPWIAQFNEVLARSERAYAQLEGFNADVAHELRTPLSTMISQLEVELARERPADELRETMESQLEESRRLSAIVSDMLFLSRADRGAKARRGQPESAVEQVHAVAEYLDVVLEEAGLQLEVRGGAMLAMDVGLFRRALTNLVANAIRHADRGSVIRVQIDQTDAAVQVIVENVGPAVDPVVLPRLFERFYRVEESRARSSSHHGLGLAIVMAIARMHDGTTYATVAGRTIRFSLELARQAAPRALVA